MRALESAGRKTIEAALALAGEDDGRLDGESRPARLLTACRDEWQDRIGSQRSSPRGIRGCVAPLDLLRGMTIRARTSGKRIVDERHKALLDKDRGAKASAIRVAPGMPIASTVGLYGCRAPPIWRGPCVRNCVIASVLCDPR